MYCVVVVVFVIIGTHASLMMDTFADSCAWCKFCRKTPTLLGCPGSSHGAVLTLTRASMISGSFLVALAVIAMLTRLATAGEMKFMQVISGAETGYVLQESYNASNFIKDIPEDGWHID